MQRETTCPFGSCNPIFITHWLYIHILSLSLSYSHLIIAWQNLPSITHYISLSHLTKSLTASGAAVLTFSTWQHTVQDKCGAPLRWAEVILYP